MYDHTKDRSCEGGCTLRWKAKIEIFNIENSFPFVSPSSLIRSQLGTYKEKATFPFSYDCIVPDRNDYFS